MKYDLCISCGNSIWVPFNDGYTCHVCGLPNSRHVYKQHAKKVLMLLSKLGVGGPDASDNEGNFSWSGSTSQDS